uniref:Uncharacterized protein n=1 Tax=viral metagenome TaxID=1070528 RepID=A0A6C0EX25_9ZZZZ
MVHKLSKSERIGKFTQLEGWFSRKMTFEYAIPDNSTKNINAFNVLKLKYIDPVGNFALYKGLIISSQATVDNLTAATATTSTVGLRGVVASYDRNTGKIKMEIVTMDDKNIATCTGKGKKFRGTVVEFGVNTAATNDVALRGGFVGGFTLDKLDVVPAGFESFNFDVAYKTRYDAVYPLGDN